MKPPKSHTFRGRRYRIVTKDYKGYNGWCEDPSSGADKELVISARLKGKELLTTLLHESIHACAWDLSEETVEEIAGAISGFVWRWGYRRADDEGHT